MGSASPARPEPRLELVEISKSFAGTRALERVSFDLRPGEVHVLAGANGAGKSTLIRVLAGAISDFSGELRLDGRAVRFASPAAAAAHGVATIHQELSLVPALSVADNLELSRPGSPFACHDRRAARARAAAALARLELTLDPDAVVETLSLAERQLVEIARVLAGNVRVLVLDEPTSALLGPDVERLISLVERLKQAGIGIVYVSHRLDEIFRLADRITVLRDGRCVFTRAARDLTREELVTAMVGGVARAPSSARALAARRVRLRVRRLSCRLPSPLRSVDFEVGVGEMVGVAGIEGSGAVTLLHALFGDARWTQGDVWLEGSAYAPQNPRAAFARGVALLAADRHASVLGDLSVLHNATLSSLTQFSRWGVLRGQAEREAAAPETDRVRLKAPSLDVPAGTLSGGNQQKVLLVRCLLGKPRLLLLDDPTRGIDVAARSDVHELLRELAASGMSVLFRSSDLGELCALADSVLVLTRSGHVATLTRAELDEARILELMMGSVA
jgi:ribose transport system ATP-binding protein